MDINPADVPMRLFRYVEPGTLPAPNVVSIYDKTQNLLIINKELYALLSADEQREVLRTQRPSITVDLPESQAA